MILSRKATKSLSQQIYIQLKGITIPKLSSIKYLGLTIDNDLSWKSHITNQRRKAFSNIRRLSPCLQHTTRKILYNTLVLPHMDYCSVVWHSCSRQLSQFIERVQNYWMRVVLDKPPGTPSAPLRDQLKWTTLHHRRHNFMLTQVHRCLLNKLHPT